MNPPRQVCRLPVGGAIRRDRPLSFVFDGRSYEGFSGDTLASALIANGVRLVGRSFKYHRPRGIVTAGSDEPNALVELRSNAHREPNSKATTVELFDGLVAHSQNRWPLLGLDLMAVNSLLSPFLAAGFYYKTFMWPAAFWERLYEPFIRRAAGLGRAAEADDPDRYEKAHAFCDLLVIGAGPAGLMAALTAARAGVRVLLCEEDFALGGRLLAERFDVCGQPGSAWAATMEAELASLPNVRTMRRTTVFGAYDGGTYGALERVADHLPLPPSYQPRQRLWKIVARRAVLASGASERPLIFAGNDRPGIMLASAVRSYVNRFAAAPGRRIAVATRGDDGWKTVADLAAAGLAIEAVVDARSAISAAHSELAARAGARVFCGADVAAAHGGRGLQAIDVTTAAGGNVRLSVDCLAVAGGWNPVIGLTCHHGAKPRWSVAIDAFVADEPPAGMAVAGAAGGDFALAAAFAAGTEAGAAAANALGFAAAVIAVPDHSEDHADLAAFQPLPSARKTAFVDFQHDVTEADIALAYREGYRSVEHLKRYTTLGMATDQGRLANLGGIATMAGLTGRSIAETGTTIYRPPHVPIAIASFAGHHRGKHFRPIRLTPSHAWAMEQGAVFTEAGLWLRAQWFPRAGESDWLASATREVDTVRGSVGVCDVSTFGKVDIQGGDAATFLDRVYINTLSTLPVGKVRYGVMLREDGFVMDDGTVARLAVDHFVATTTTANAAPVMQHLDFCRQVLWPELDVQLASVSEQWAQFSIAGPRARDVLAKLLDQPFDLSNAGFPYLAAASLTVCEGIAGRLFRVSFSGELAFELAVPSRHGDAVIRAIMAAGRDYGIAPYGTEALGIMRIEKGHVAGNELNGQTTARDLGLGRMIAARKDFVGRRLAERPALLDPGRPCIVGFRPVEKTARLAAGAHFLPLDAADVAAHDEGYMTSVAFSPSLGHWIGLGLLTRGAERIGERLRAFDGVRRSAIEVEICRPAFLDPEGSRLHG